VPDPGPGPERDICPSEPERDEIVDCTCGYDRIPHPDDGGRCFLCFDCEDICEVEVPTFGPVFDGAELVWYGTGDYAAIGPALSVHSDGTVRIWHSIAPFDPELGPDRPADQELALEWMRTEQLFHRWLAAEGAEWLPHDEPGSLCQQMLFVRTCADCEPTRIDYTSPGQLIPELGCVLSWLSEELGEPGLDPVTFCAF
jgi:hypothetical protein